jgi:uncharacterized RDD family membrane protein YckC
MSHDDNTDVREPKPTAPESPQKLPADKARQGRWGGRVLMILVVALVLAAIAWWAAEIYGVAIEPTNPMDNAPQPSTQQNQAQ